VNFLKNEEETEERKKKNQLMGQRTKSEFSSLPRKQVFAVRGVLFTTYSLNTFLKTFELENFIAVTNSGFLMSVCSLNSG
jgi:hypothetical protein